MGKKFKYFLVRNRGGEYIYSRGDLLDSDISELALVKTDIYKDLSFKGEWSIIDIKSGLYIFKNKSKKKLLEFFEERCKYNLKEAVEKARKRDNYSNNVSNANKEKEQWREAGYELDM